jgi:NadR type nicotinamide-nucleotide adenylyltransferase
VVIRHFIFVICTLCLLRLDEMAQNSLKKIAVIGAESTGKTWLCEALAQHYKTVWVPEYAREYFNDSDIYNYTLEDLIVIAKKQIQLEETLIHKATDFLFCDTTLITLKIWAELEFHQTPEFIQTHLQKIKYDHYFITNNEVSWMADEQRQNKHDRELLFNMNLEEVQRAQIPYTIITGIEQERLELAIKSL